jgi:holo-[acyl-carrier protein] synthase
MSVGIDLLEVERLERALARRPRLAQRLFRPGELAHASRRRRPAMHLAARFAAKEAALKALAAQAVPLCEIEVEGGGDTAPRLRLHGSAAEIARRQGVRLEVSLTHTRAHAAAVVQALRAGPR